jgi:hypothetical protein
MNPDALNPTVAAIVGYDIFPYYAVTKGELTNTGGIRAVGVGIYSADSVIRIFPEGEYESLENQRAAIKNIYREKERQLRIDILEQVGVDFVTVK